MALGNKTSSRKSRALKYASRGLRVVAMQPVKDGCCGCSKGKACDRPGKHPMTPHGVKDATTDRNQIKSWWTESPDANIGIATGSEAGILVLDIDPRNKGMETLARLKKELGPTALL
jgi:putative DNA primase/helicase